jgi:alkylated DNA repair dioxygenase AlkB
VLQLSLLASAATAGLDPVASPRPRRTLDGGAWLDVVPGWITGADALYQDVLESAPWKAHQRIMWDKLVDEPRLSAGRWSSPPDPLPALARALTEHYQLDLTSISANWYRDGRDSVAWHGDTAGRRRDTTIVAILSLGSPRRFLLRPKGGGRSVALTPAHGDLVVLGGTCQRTWDHAVPKMAHAGSRISVMFREPGVF